MIIAECSISGPVGLIVSARTGKSAKGNITEQHFRSDGMENGHRRMSAYGEHEWTLAGMKTYWCVTTSVYDDGRVIAAITNSIRAVKAPKNESKSLRRKDVYHDWFDSKEEADQFVEDAKNA